jgi:hypothetical protein
VAVIAGAFLHAMAFRSRGCPSERDCRLRLARVHTIDPRTGQIGQCNVGQPQKKAARACEGEGGQFVRSGDRGSLAAAASLHRQRSRCQTAGQLQDRATQLAVHDADMLLAIAGRSGSTKVGRASRGRPRRADGLVSPLASG